MIPVSVPDLSGDSQDQGDSFFQDSFVPYDPANEAREENDEYGEDEEDEDISRRLEERGDFIQTTSYDYDGDLGDDEESLH